MTERPNINNGTKRCTKCKQVLPLTKFQKDSTRSTGYQPKCRPCRQSANRRVKTRQYNRNHRISKTYGLTADEYSLILAYQCGGCAICGGARRYKLHVDHCHKTGEVRGLLCKACNGRLLTAARDNPDTLRRAATYLESPPARAALGAPHFVPAGTDDPAGDE